MLKRAAYFLKLALAAFFLCPFALIFVLTHEDDFQERLMGVRIIVDPLKDIMYGLIYPAILGTGLVLFVSHVAKSDLSWIDDPVRFPAISAGLFYILSYTALSGGAEDNKKLSYKWLTFLSDWIEVALMFACFYFLGLIDEHHSSMNIRVRLGLAYGCLLIDVILVQPFWRLAAGTTVWKGGKQRLFVSLLLAAAIMTIGSPKLHPSLDMVIALSVLVFVAYYIHDDVKNQLKASQA